VSVARRIWRGPLVLWIVLASEATVVGLGCASLVGDFDVLPTATRDSGTPAPADAGTAVPMMDAMSPPGHPAAGPDSGSPGGGPPALLIDSFENGSSTPDSTLFSPWFYYTYNPPNQPASSSVIPGGFDSNFAIYLSFQLQDFPNGYTDYPGAGLGTHLKTGFRDFSAYTYITFDAKLSLDLDGSVAATPYIRVRVTCPMVSSLSVSGGFQVSNGVTVGTDWAAYVLPLAEFQEPPDQTSVAVFNADACLKMFTGIDFTYDPMLSDGQGISGTLTLDNIVLQ
jgi:hypothetical protein